MKKYLPIILIFFLTFNLHSQVYINEVDYDMPGTDASEFIELVGPGNSSLNGYTIELVNGNNGSIYNTLDLSAFTIPDDNVGGYGFFVIGPASGVANVDYTPTGWTENQIQNGAPDGILLKLNGTIVDGFSYEGPITNNPDFTPGMAITAQDAGSDNSIGRITLGFDSNNEDQYFAPDVATPSPGEQNIPHGQNLTGAAAPHIQNVLVEPFPADQPFSIFCTVTIDSGSIDSVFLKYYTDFDTLTFDSIQMLNSGGDQFSGSIPAQTNGTSFIYWVKAWGNEVTSTSMENRVVIGIPGIMIFHTQLNTNGLPLHMDHLVRIRGIVTVSNGIFATDRYDFYMQDNTGGINVFSFNYTPDSTQYLEGDSLEVVGTIETFNGKVEIIDFGATILSRGNPLPVPLNINIEDMGEEYEGRLIAIDNVGPAVGSPAWPSQPQDENLVITDGTGELTLRIVDSTYIGGNPEPTWPVTVIGIGTQYDTEAPYFENYQIQPRSYADFLVTGIGDKQPPLYTYRLEQNYPNPFNPVTTIPFELKTASDIDFRIFNLLGEEVIHINGYRTAGPHTIIFDGKNLPSGIYFYRLNSGEFSALKKMILIK